MNRRVSALRRSDVRGENNSMLNDDSDVDWATSTRRDTEWWRHLGNDSGSRFFPTNTRHTKVDDTVVVEESYISFKLQEVYELSDDENFSMESMSDISRASDKFVRPKGLFKVNSKKPTRASVTAVPALPAPMAETSHLPKIQVDRTSTSQVHEDDYLNDISVNKSLSFHNNSSIGASKPKTFFKSNVSMKKVNFDDVINNSKDVSNNVSDYLMDVSNPEHDMENRPKKSFFKSNNQRKSKLFADAVSLTESNHSERFVGEDENENSQNISNVMVNRSNPEKIAEEEMIYSNRSMEKTNPSRGANIEDELEVDNRNNVLTYEDIDNIRLRPSKNATTVSNSVTLDGNFTLNNGDAVVPKKSLFKSSNPQRRTQLFAAAVSMAESDRSGVHNESQDVADQMDASGSHVGNVSHNKSVDRDKTVNANEDVMLERQDDGNITDKLSDITHVNNTSSARNTTLASVSNLQDYLEKPKKSLFNFNSNKRKSTLFAAAVSFAESNKSHSFNEELETSSGNSSKRMKLSSPKSIGNNLTVETTQADVDTSQKGRITESTNVDTSVSHSVTQVSLHGEVEKPTRSLFKSSNKQRKSTLFAEAISLSETSEELDDGIQENLSAKQGATQNVSSRETQENSVRIADEDVETVPDELQVDREAETEEIPNTLETVANVETNPELTEQVMTEVDKSLKQNETLGDKSFAKRKSHLIEDKTSEEQDDSIQSDIPVSDKSLAAEEKSPQNESGIPASIPEEISDEEILSVEKSMQQNKTMKDKSFTIEKSLVNKEQTHIKETLNKSETTDVNNTSVAKESNKTTKRDTTSKVTDKTLSDESITVETINKSKASQNASELAVVSSSNDQSIEGTLNKSRTRSNTSQLMQKSPNANRETLNKSENSSEQVVVSPINDPSMDKGTLNVSRTRRSTSQLSHKSPNANNETLNKSKTQENTLEHVVSPINDQSMDKGTLNTSRTRRSTSQAFNKSPNANIETLNKSKVSPNSSERGEVSPINDQSIEGTLNKSKTRRNTSQLSHESPNSNKERLNKSKTQENNVEQIVSPVKEKSLSEKTLNKSQPTVNKTVANESLNKSQTQQVLPEEITSLDKTGTGDQTLRNKSLPVANETTLLNKSSSGEKIGQEFKEKSNTSVKEKSIQDLPNKSVKILNEEVYTPRRNLRNRSLLSSSKTIIEEPEPSNASDVQSQSTTLQDSYNDLGITEAKSIAQQNKSSDATSRSYSQTQVNTNKSNSYTEQSVDEMNSASNIGDKTHSYNTMFNATNKKNVSTENNTLEDNVSQNETNRKSQSYNTMFHVSKQNFISSDNNDTEEAEHSERRDVDTVEGEDTVESEDDEREEQDEQESESKSDDTSAEEDNNSGDDIVLNMSDHDVDDMVGDVTFAEDSAVFDDQPVVVVRPRQRMQLYSTFAPEKPAPVIRDPVERERREQELFQRMTKVYDRIVKEAEEEVAKLFDSSTPTLHPFLMRDPENILPVNHNKTPANILETKTSKRFLAGVRGSVEKPKSRMRRMTSDGGVTKNSGVKKNKLYMKELWITRRLYNFIQNKLKPKYGLMSVKESETFVKFLANIVKHVEKCSGREAHPRVEQLRTHMANMDIVSTHRDFNTFVAEYLPHTFRLRSIPAVGRDVPKIKGKLDDLIVKRK